MSRNIIHINEGAIRQELMELVSNSDEEALIALLDQEEAELTKAGCYDRTEESNVYRTGHYERNNTLCVKG